MPRRLAVGDVERVGKGSDHIGQPDNRVVARHSFPIGSSRERLDRSFRGMANCDYQDELRSGTLSSMRRTMALIATIAASASVAQAHATLAGTIRSCGSLTVGPTALKTGGSGPGAPCMLVDFAQCVPATYSLSSFGVDTIRRSIFTIVARTGACSVSVTQTFRVVPRQARPTAEGRCTSIVRFRGDIVAKGCRGAGLAVTMSLEGRTD